jgi:hypothetical protein
MGAGMNMSSGEARKDASVTCNAARCSGAREALGVLIMLYGLTQGIDALAGDSSPGDSKPDVVKDIRPIVGGTPLSLDFLPNKSASNDPQFSTSEFSPRRAGTTQSTKPVDAEFVDETQALRVTSAWQRLADYRAQGRVQLLTLWQSQRSTVSLQAGHHGGPSLQWSSRTMNHGGATRGLLDRFVPSSLGAAGLGPKVLVHGASYPTATKNFTLLPAPKSP